VSEPPPDLPETGDPFELLGVEPGASEIEIKRAYVRLIKRFRPDRAPEEFQRIHAAYEQARARTRWVERAEPDLDDGWELGDAPDKPDKPDEPAPAWFADARAAARQGPAALAEVIARAIAERRAGAADLAIELDHASLGRLVRRPELCWDNLREQDNRWAALELLGLRFDRMLLGDDPAVIAEISDPLFRRDLLSEPELEDLALRVLIRAAWVGDERADNLYAMVSDTTSSSNFRLHALYRSARTLGSTLEELVDRRRVPMSLARFIANFPQVGADARIKLLSAVDRDIGRLPREALGAIDAMARADIQLVYLLEEICDDVLWADDARLDDLPANERAYIDGVMTGADIELRADQSPGLRLAAAAGLTAIAALLLPPAFAALAGFSAITAVLFWSYLPEPRAYALHARPRFAEIAATYGITPEHIVEWIGRHVRLRYRFGLEVAVGDDIDLHVFARLSRLCILWRD
jgi:hypothetical protein